MSTAPEARGDRRPPSILVTGARGGIGEAIAECVAAAGNLVVAGDLVPPPPTPDAPAGADPITWVELDVTDQASVRKALDVALGLGPLRGVVNCAGVLDETPADPDDDEAPDRMLAVNLAGAMRVTRMAAAHLDRGAALVNITSIAASGGSAPAVSGYAASKGGLEAYTRAMACELGPRGIRVNAVAPGIIRAPMAGLLLDAPGGEERVVRRVPLGRLGEPEDIAEVVEFLLSDRAAYVNGTVVTVDGGIRAT